MAALKQRTCVGTSVKEDVELKDLDMNSDVMSGQVASISTYRIIFLTYLERLQQPSISTDCPSSL